MSNHAPPPKSPPRIREIPRRAAAVGVNLDRMTVSEHCMRCTGSGLFSHRADDAKRQAGYLRLRP